MLKTLQWFMEKLAQRLVAIVGSWVSSSVETMQALDEAEQQAQLEAAARAYEADGNLGAAELLRQRAAQIGSENPAHRAIGVMRNLGVNQAELPAPDNNASPASPTTSLTDLDRPMPKSRGRRSARQSTNES